MKSTVMTACLIVTLLFSYGCANKISAARPAPGIDNSQLNVASDCPQWFNTYTGVQSGTKKYIQTRNDLNGNLNLIDQPITFIVTGQPKYMVGNKTQSYSAYCTTAQSPAMSAAGIPASKAIVIPTYQGGQPWQIINYIQAGNPNSAIQYYVTDPTGKTVLQDELFTPPNYVPTTTTAPAQQVPAQQQPQTPEVPI